MGSQYNLNVKRQRQVMLSALLIGVTFSIRAALSAVLAVGNSDSSSWFPTRNPNATTSEVELLSFACALCHAAAGWAAAMRQ